MTVRSNDPLAGSLAGVRAHVLEQMLREKTAREVAARLTGQFYVGQKAYWAHDPNLLCEIIGFSETTKLVHVKTGSLGMSWVTPNMLRAA